MLHLPVLDPSTPAEALAMTRFAFELSEAGEPPGAAARPRRGWRTGAPWSTFGALQSPWCAASSATPPRYVPVPANARRMRLEIKERIGQGA